MKKNLFLIFLLLSFFQQAFAQPAVAKKLLSGLTIDGAVDESVWAFDYTVTKTVSGTPNNTVTYAALWDDNNLYVAVKVLDANLFSNGAFPWDNDAVEVFVDANNNKGNSYDSKDIQIAKGYNTTTVWTSRAATNLVAKWAAITGGYSVEFAIPWTVLGVTPVAANNIGFDIAIDDNDAGAGRTSQLAWKGDGNNWSSTANFGTLTLSATTIGASDTQAPSIPTGLNATNITDNSFTLNWAASTDNVSVFAYEVYRNNILHSTVTQTNVNVIGLNPSTLYAMTVKAKDLAANISAASTALNVTTSIAAALTTINFEVPPTGTLNSPVYTEANYTFKDLQNNAIGNESLQIFGINDGYSSQGLVNSNYDRGIRMTKSDNTKFDLVSLKMASNPWGDGADAIVTGYVTGGTTVSATITATSKAFVITTLNWTNLTSVDIVFSGGTNNSFGVLDDIVVSSATSETTPPTAPTGLVSSAITANSFVLSWTASTDNVGVTSYEVFDGATSKGTTATTSINITGLNAATVYNMTVKAKDAAGNVSVASTSLTVTTTSTDLQAPTAPNGLIASNIGATSFDLNWTAATDDVGVTGYDVFVNGVLKTSVSTTSASISALVASTAYTITVKAKDASGKSSAASTALTVTTIALPVANNKNYVGMNINGVQDYAEDRPFADAFRSARDFKKIGSSVARSAAVDSRGWPTEDAEVIVWHGISKMNGTYRLKFTGNATLAMGWGSGAIQNKVYDAATNTTTASLVYNSTDGAGLKLTFTSTGGGVKDVKLMRPVTQGSSQSYPFNTEFTDQIKNLIAKFQCLRYLGWDATNWNISKTWSDRVSDDFHWGSNDPTGYGWEGRGASWESMIRLNNETNTDAFINVPISADDNYITQLATLWKNNLNPGLKLYVEYSNEIWNWGFSQSQQNVADAKLEFANTPYPLNFDGNAYQDNYPWRRVAKKTVQISNIFRSVWGDAAMMTTVRPVLMWQQPNGQATASTMLEWLNYFSEQSSKPVNYYIYGGGGSAYYNPDNMSNALTIDNIWSSETFNTANWQVNNATDASYAAAMGIKRIAYEGGPSMDNTGQSEAVKSLAVDDPRMQGNVTTHHTMWSNNGGDLLCYLAATGDDYQWNFARSIFNLNTPKMRAIDEINVANRAANTFGKSIPAIIDAGNTDLTGGNTYITPGNAGLRTASNIYGNGWAGYALNATTAGTYNVSFQVHQNWSYTGSIKIYLDGAYLGTESVSSPGQISATYPVSLTAGLHFVRFYNISNGEVVLANIIISSVVLPVTFISFTGNATVAGNDLKWVVANEINNKQFDVERSENGINFTKIGEVTSTAPNGNNPLPSTYLFTDKGRPVSAFYRLKQIDLDGTFKLSNMVYLNSTFYTKATNHVYPNPVTDKLNLVVFADKKESLQVQVIDQVGRSVFNNTIFVDKGKNNLIINMLAQPVGLYILTAKNAAGNTVLMSKVIKN